MNLLTRRSGGSGQSDSIFLLKPPKLVSYLVLSWLDYCNAFLASPLQVPIVKIVKSDQHSNKHIAFVFPVLVC